MDAEEAIRLRRSVRSYTDQPVDDADISLPTDGYQSPDAIRELLGGIISKSKSAPRPRAKAAEPPKAADTPKDPGTTADAAPGLSQP